MKPELWKLNSLPLVIEEEDSEEEAEDVVREEEALALTNISSKETVDCSVDCAKPQSAHLKFIAVTMSPLATAGQERM